MGQPPHTDNSATSQPCASLEISDVFFLLQFLLRWADVCICVCVVYSSFHQDFCPQCFLAAQHRRKRPVGWNSFPLTFFLSHRPLPVLLDICIRHSFESQRWSISLLCSFKSYPWGKMCSQKTLGPKSQGENKRTRPTQTNRRGKLWSFIFLELLILLLCEWTVLAYFFCVQSALWILANYCTPTSSVFRDHPLLTETK